MAGKAPPCSRRRPSQSSSGSSGSGYASSSTSSSSQTSLDEDDANVRVTPYWCSYRSLIQTRGFRLDTYKDVKDWYHDYWASLGSEGHAVSKDLPGYIRACRGKDENELCRDDGLPERLFRGTQCSTGTKVVIKAVHLHSREYDVIRHLSSPPLRSHPMNHCIPVLDLIEVPRDNLAFIVMEEWSSQLVAETPCDLGHFLSALRQCIEHIVFMHAHRIAHLDVSLRNILTNYKGHYACIDYETSTRYDGSTAARTSICKGTEIPPELERGEWSDPYKVDVYALGVLLLRAMDLTGYDVPELHVLVKPMLSSRFEQRPTAQQVLVSFNAMVSQFPSRRLRMTCPNQP
ncbi:kinase-like domain-containing protein [Lenzites betulinus]|nr:kinase-like domain-containing protein [Lenzites betulinus]